MNKKSFAVSVDPAGVEYVHPTYHEKEKNHLGVNSKEREKQAIMSAQPDDPSRCPVNSFKLYLSKLNDKCDALFQRPTHVNYESSNVWYDNVQCAGWSK